MPKRTSFLASAALSKSSLVVFRFERMAPLALASSTFSSSDFFSKGLAGNAAVLTLLKSKSILAYGSLEVAGIAVAPPPNVVAEPPPIPPN